MTTEPVVLRRVPEAVRVTVEIPGSVRGRLIGGNLASLATSVGILMPSMAGAILFREDQRGLSLGTIDRQLTQLMSSGARDPIVGFSLGSFEGFRYYSDRAWILTDVLTDRLSQLGVQVPSGLYAGHDLINPDGTSDPMALPLGSPATLDTTTGTVTADPVVC